MNKLEAIRHVRDKTGASLSVSKELVETLAPQLDHPAPAAPTKTLHDEYAMAALQGMLASGGPSTETYDHIRIRRAFLIADAMMKERDRG